MTDTEKDIAAEQSMDNEIIQKEQGDIKFWERCFNCSGAWDIKTAIKDIAKSKRIILGIQAIERNKAAIEECKKEIADCEQVRADCMSYRDDYTDVSARIDAYESILKILEDN